MKTIQIVGFVFDRGWLLSFTYRMAGLVDRSTCHTCPHLEDTRAAPTALPARPVGACSPHPPAAPPPQSPPLAAHLCPPWPLVATTSRFPPPAHHRQHDGRLTGAPRRSQLAARRRPPLPSQPARRRLPAADASAARSLPPPCRRRCGCQRAPVAVASWLSRSRRCCRRRRLSAASRLL